MRKAPVFSIPDYDRPKEYCGENRSVNFSETLKQQSDQLTTLKDQYMSMKNQYQKEQKEYSITMRNLENQLRSEIQRVEDLENEISELEKMMCCNSDGGSVAVVERIWSIMKKYHDDAWEICGDKQECVKKPGW